MTARFACAYEPCGDRDYAVLSEDVEFAQLMRRLEARDAGAFPALYARYGEAIRGAVRQQLNDRLRPQFDSLDFVQDVWASFVALPAEKCRFANPQALGRFLSRVARNKVIEVFRRRFRTRAFNIAREQPLDATAGATGAMPDPGPSPSQVAMAGEQWEEMARSLPRGQKAILDRLRDGYTHAEVAAMLGVHVRTIERVVRRLKDLQEM